MNLEAYKNHIYKEVTEMEDEIADLKKTIEQWKNKLNWVIQVSQMKPGYKLHLKNSPAWSANEITIEDIKIADTCDCGVSVKAVGYDDYKSAIWFDKAHALTIKPVANGAGMGFCTCGWRSRVSEDRYMYDDDYYSQEDIKKDFEEHVKNAR